MWEQISSNRTRSIVLVIIMGLLLLLLGYFLGIAFFDSGILGLILAIVVWIIMNLIAYFQGDNILLGMAKARKIEKEDYPRLYNIVEEMKLASGLEHMPTIYIIDDPASNAFATGRDPKQASVAVTTGLLQVLNRDELQGVIGHELSHVKNRDVLLMAMCSILLGTIVIIAYYASRFLIFGGVGNRRRSSSGGGSAQLIILIIGLVFMILAPIAAQFIYFAISRKREYLADASSALYTRYPEGLASALEKIASSTNQLKSANNATAPMYIINPFRKQGLRASDLTSTHPPISERIRILRSMAGGASYKDYNQAYQQIHKGSNVMPPSALGLTEPVPLRSAQTGTAQAGGAYESGRRERAREINDLLWKKDNYIMLDCSCGTRLKIPPEFKNAIVRCPHCGKVHQV
ncbi:MAG TPA: peptidase M28 [Dehalococcoidia bacterium]|nr:peptidase M28 [Dehalococcoidia bacterium]